MTYLNQSKGRNPKGQQVSIPVEGQAFVYDTMAPGMNAPLAAGASINTGWMATEGFGSMIYAIRADQASDANGILIEYSDDGVTPNPAGLAFPYTQVGQQIQRALAPKRKFTRITFKNGAAPQTYFWFEVKLSTSLIQPTESSVNVPMADTNLAMVVKSMVEAKETEAGNFGPIFRTGNALNVNVTNPAAGSPSANTVNQTTVNLTTTVKNVLAANNDRKGASIFAESTCLILLGSGASSTSYTLQMRAGDYFEVPFKYTGLITGITTSGSANVRVMEFV